MKKQLPAWAVLCIIALLAGLMLGATNELTSARIAEQTLLEALAARQNVLPGAHSFEEQVIPDDAGIDACFVGMSDGAVVGYTAQSTVRGYGGSIEVIIGMNAEGIITGINVGGEGFSETPGLGAKTKDTAFTEQFRNIQSDDINNREIVHTVTSATISSNAVIRGVKACATYIESLLVPPEAEPSDEEGGSVTFTNLVEQPKADGIDAWWIADEGKVVKASSPGFGGLVTATVGILADGTIASVELEAPNETPGIGDQVLMQISFAEQFIGQSSPLEADTISGATFSSSAAIEAVRAAVAFTG